jgi:hypothetical protein
MRRFLLGGICGNRAACDSKVGPPPARGTIGRGRPTGRACFDRTMMIINNSNNKMELFSSSCAIALD